MKKTVTIAAYLAGVTTLAVTVPAMAGTQHQNPLKQGSVSKSEAVAMELLKDEKSEM